MERHLALLVFLASFFYLYLFRRYTAMDPDGYRSHVNSSKVPCRDGTKVPVPPSLALLNI